MSRALALGSLELRAGLCTGLSRTPERYKLCSCVTGARARTENPSLGGKQPPVQPAAISVCH